MKVGLKKLESLGYPLRENPMMLQLLVFNQHQHVADRWTDMRPTAKLCCSKAECDKNCISHNGHLAWVFLGTTQKYTDFLVTDRIQKGRIGLSYLTQNSIIYFTIIKKSIHPVSRIGNSWVHKPY